MNSENNHAQNLLDDLFRQSGNNKRKLFSLPENQTYLEKTDNEKKEYLTSLVNQGANPTNVFLRASYVAPITEIDFLIQLGADMNYRSNVNGHVALTRSIVTKSTKQIRLLLESNANINVEFRGMNPLLMAIKFDTTELLQKFNDTDLFSINNIPQGLFIHKIAENDLLLSIITKKQGKKLIYHYLQTLEYKSFEKDKHNKTLHDYVKNIFCVESEDQNIVNELATILLKNHLENSIETIQTNNRTPKI